jgi:predicted dehydrogenase
MNFLVLGGGSIGKRHIRNLRSMGHTSIYCLKRQHDFEFEKETGACVITSLDGINRPIDGVIICTPTSLHNEGLKIAIDLNAAVFMEKPLIHSVDALRESGQLLQRLKKPFFIGFMLRFHPMVKKIMELLHANVVGHIYSGRFEFGSYLPYWHPWEDHRISYASRRDLGGGVINTITHELDLMQYFFGVPQAVTCTSRNLSKLDIEVEEIADAIFEYDDKVITLHLDYLQKDYNRSIKFLGDDGSSTWNWHDEKVVVARHKSAVEEFKLEPSFDINDVYKEEFSLFIQLIQNGVQDHTLNGSYAIENTQLMLLMHQSSLNRKTVEVTIPTFKI